MARLDLILKNIRGREEAEQPKCGHIAYFINDNPKEITKYY